jgi:dienelactone hydrolase
VSAFRCRLFLPIVACLAFAGGCTRQAPDIGVTPLKVADTAELQKYLLSRKPDLDLFRLRGPFRITERKAVEIGLSTGESVRVDLFLCAAADNAPLVILLHGHGNVKEDHAFQAMHIASWGMHAMPLQLPSYGPWIANGRKLALLVKAIRQAPGIVDGRADVNRIILVGHSFGATAVSAALGEGAAVTGAVLLDPAGIGRQLPALLKKVSAPVMLIGADEEIWPTRNRAYFYRFIPAGIAEVSIKDAVHEDAQYPTERTVRGFEDGPLDTEEAQITFVSALTAAAFSLSATGALDYAWSSFEGVFATGRFFNARRK